MTSNEPEQPFRGVEYPSLEDSPKQANPNAPVDYPTDPGLPPPIYPTPPPAYPPGYPPAPGYYPGVGYDPYDPYRQMRPPGTNGMAIAALAVSVASVVLFCGITSFVGVILGVIAIRQTRTTGQEGFGFALAATVIG
ncbi:MAG TPA: DUF4190 domain-containing protein, partial [Mycobacterium sp.]|nr:DUF4190 domain-containing protein [Mycobacterium sp.]